MTIIMYGIKNCDTIKKARKWLDDKSIEYKFHDYKKEGISKDKLSVWIDHFGWENVINRKGTSWRALPENIRNNINEKSAINLMVENQSLIKRPIVESGQNRLIGFDEEKYKTSTIFK